MNKTRNTCSMRHENGNCLAVGGFCTAVNDEICQALHNAYEMGKASLNIVHCNNCKYEKDCENLYSIFCNGFCNLGELNDELTIIDPSLTEDEYNKGLNDLGQGMRKTAEEKITCKDCKHCYRSQGVNWGVNSCWGYRCEKRGVISPIPVRPDYSCHYAEKREEE